MLTGQEGQRAGDSLMSVTKGLRSPIVLVDTPGFDDSKGTDKQILGLMAYVAYAASLYVCFGTRLNLCLNPT